MRTNYRKMRPLNPEQALDRAQKICSKQEKCPEDIRKKLFEWGISDENADKIITSLKESRFIDETRYTKQFVKDKINLNKWGKQKIYYALLERKIPEQTIQEAIKEINEESYLQMIRHVLQKKLDQIPDNTDNANRKAKLLRYAQNKGYDQELSYNIISSLMQNIE